MRQLIRRYWAPVALGSFIACIIAVAVSSELSARGKRTKAMVARKDFCERICTDREKGVFRVDRQKIGFGSFEWRCYCEGGHWQAVP